MYGQSPELRRDPDDLIAFSRRDFKVVQLIPHDRGAPTMPTRNVCLTVLGLMKVDGWQMAPLPVPHGRAQCVTSHTSARHAAPPQMCSDYLSSEFQVCVHDPSGVSRHTQPCMRRHRGWRTSARAQCLVSLKPCYGSIRWTVRGCYSLTPASGTRACTLKPMARLNPTRV